MKLTKINPIQEITDMVTFFEKRNAKKLEFNKEIKALKKKLQTEAKKNKETILFSIPLDETIVFLGKQLRENLYQNFDLDYPETGLFLKEIKIVHVEYIGDTRFKYQNNIIIQYKFEKECFNNYISLYNLGFDDEKRRIVEQTIGLGFDPCFADEEKYFEVKDLLKMLKNKINAK